MTTPTPTKNRWAGFDWIEIGTLAWMVSVAAENGCNPPDAGEPIKRLIKELSDENHRRFYSDDGCGQPDCNVCNPATSEA
jgi:hypothetical protein